MATGMSVLLKNLVLDAIFNNAPFAFDTPTISLHTGDPGANGANEVVGGSYSRVAGAAKFPAAAAGAVSNDAEIRFNGLPACTVTHFGFWSPSAFLWGGELATPRTVVGGDFAAFAVGEFDATLT